MELKRPGLPVIASLSHSTDRYDGVEMENRERPIDPFEIEERQGYSAGFGSFPGREFRKFKILEHETVPAKNQQREQELPVVSDNGLLDGLHYDVESPPLQTCLKEIAQQGRITDEQQEIIDSTEIPLSTLPSLLEPLHGRASACKRMESYSLSTVEIMRAAVAKFPSIPMDHGRFYHYMNSEEVRKEVQLVELLMAVAERVGTGRFKEALAMLDNCDQISSISGNPVERIAFYFSGALRERIDRQTTPAKNYSDCFSKTSIDLKEAIINYNPPIIAHHQMVPFCQLQQICAAQIIEEHVATAKRIHVIDLAIRCGVQWVALMQALASRHEHPVELLKITAIGSLSEDSIEKTGERLELFARSLNLPFKFKMVMLSDMDILNEDLFHIEEDESVVVSAQFSLRIWVPLPAQLESLMTVIKRINPCIMVVTEVNWNFNSLSLFSRFKEALFYFSAYFDCLDDCMERDDDNRTIFEFVFFGKAIRTIIATEGEERTYTNVTVDVWRAFFAWFGMVEVDLSKRCLYLADLVKNNFKCAGSCTLGIDGKSLIIGWKGTPMHFVSAWKFQ